MHSSQRADLSQWAVLTMVLVGAWIGMSQAATYAVIDMGTCIGQAIANDETMAGSCIIDGAQMAARGQVDSFSSLGQRGRANAQGEDGITVGYSGSFGPGDINQEASLWDANGQLTLLGLLPGGAASAATGRNSAGLVSFYADDASQTIHGGYWDASGFHPLSGFPDDVFADGIDDANEILITAFLEDDFPHAMLCTLDGACIDLQPADAALSYGRHLTSTGLATGTVYDVDTFTLHAARGTAATGLVRLADLAGLHACDGLGSNGRGETVGTCGVSGQDRLDHGIFWAADGQTMDLNTALADTGWVVNEALSINDAGVITAICTTPEGMQNHGCLLVPQQPVALDPGRSGKGKGHGQGEGHTKQAHLKAFKTHVSPHLPAGLIRLSQSGKMPPSALAHLLERW
jgi:hypothetical protein